MDEDSVELMDVTGSLNPKADPRRDGSHRARGVRSFSDSEPSKPPAAPLPDQQAALGTEEAGLRMPSSSPGAQHPPAAVGAATAERDAPSHPAGFSGSARNGRAQREEPRDTAPSPNHSQTNGSVLPSVLRKTGAKASPMDDPRSFGAHRWSVSFETKEPEGAHGHLASPLMGKGFVPPASARDGDIPERTCRTASISRDSVTSTKELEDVQRSVSELREAILGRAEEEKALHQDWLALLHGLAGKGTVGTSALRRTPSDRSGSALSGNSMRNHVPGGTSARPFSLQTVPGGGRSGRQERPRLPGNTSVNSMSKHSSTLSQTPVENARAVASPARMQRAKNTVRYRSMKALRGEDSSSSGEPQRSSFRRTTGVGESSRRGPLNMNGSESRSSDDTDFEEDSGRRNPAPSAASDGIFVEDSGALEASKSAALVPESTIASATNQKDPTAKEKKRRRRRLEQNKTGSRRTPFWSRSHSTDSWAISTLDLLFLIIAFASSIVTIYVIHPLAKLAQHDKTPSAIVILWFVVVAAFSLVWMASRFFVRRRSDVWEVTDDLGAIRQSYLRSWFVYDLLFTVPFEFIFIGWRNDAFYYCLSKHFLRVFRVVTLGTNDNPLMESRQWYRLVSFLGILFIFLFIEASVFWSLEERTQGVSFTDSFYWATVTMTSVGYGDIVTRSGWGGQIFSAISCIIGVLLVASLTAFATDFLTTKDVLSEELDRKKKMMYSMLTYYEIPWEVQREVISLFPAVLDAQSEVQFKHLIEALPPFVAEKMERYLRAKMLRNVPLFAELQDEDIITQLTQKLERRFAPPYEYVIVVGDTGTEMYFLVHGVVEVLIGNIDAGEEKVVATLRTGAYFGEIALIDECNRRTASIQTVVGCELLVLSKKDFDSILMHSDELQRRIKKEVDVRKQQNRSLEASIQHAALSVSPAARRTPVNGGRNVTAPSPSVGGEHSALQATNAEEDHANHRPGPGFVEPSAEAFCESDQVPDLRFSPATTMAADDFSDSRKPSLALSADGAANIAPHRVIASSAPPHNPLHSRDSDSPQSLPDYSFNVGPESLV